MKRFILFFLYILIFFTVKATETDSLRVSLLTVMPYNNKVYTIYGHSALRICDLKRNTDIVFNWGTFSFKTPHFLYRFLKGETDYFLSTTDYYKFIQYYNLLNATIIEQILYLPSERGKCLLQMLSINLQPENRIYRYNFLKDNCATRIRNLIEKITDSRLDISDSTYSVTIRQLIYSCTYSHPWIAFGIDFLIGSEADKPISKREALFLPVQLKETMDSFICNSGDPLVISSHQILQANCKKKHSSFWNSPIQVGWLVFCIYGILTITTTITICNCKKSKIIFDILKIIKMCFAFLFLLTAIAGYLLIFFVLFSCHPCTSPNWNLFWANPFHLVAFIGYFFRKPFLWISIYHWCNLALLLVFLLGKSWLPQNLNPAIVPYMICLMWASLSYLVYKKWLK